MSSCITSSWCHCLVCNLSCGISWSNTTGVWVVGFVCSLFSCVVMSVLFFSSQLHVRIQGGGGGQGVRIPENSQHHRVSFLAILVRIPWKITKLPSQHSMLGLNRPASETQCKWRFAGWPIRARFKWCLDPLSPHQRKQIKQTKRGQSWTPSDNIFWILA